MVGCVQIYQMFVVGRALPHTGQNGGGGIATIVIPCCNIFVILGFTTSSGIDEIAFFGNACIMLLF